MLPHIVRAHPNCLWATRLCVLCCAAPGFEFAVHVRMPLVAIHPYIGLWRDHSCSEASALCSYGGIQPDEAQQLVTADTPAADKLNSLWP